MQRQSHHGHVRIFCLLAFVSSLVNCREKKAGQPCVPTEVACVDEHLGLFCWAGKLETMTCLGPSGCQKVGSDEVACDNPQASVGDGCNHEDDAACSLDRTTSLVCKGGRFVVAQPCRGPRGCSANGDTVYCDNALAEPGDLCTEEGDRACKSDRSAFMKCQKGVFGVTNGCRGPRKCQVTEKPDENKEHFECDDSVTSLGDPCEDDGEESCAVDGKASHVCRNHQVVMGRACPGPKGCSFDAAASRFRCDMTKR
jgi:hypothetical protein